MRIIAGSARGRRIFSVPKHMMVKPISGRMRQSLFDILKPRITGAYFLDLFAGTGAVGLEALSRSALKVVFIERDKRCVEVIEKNLERAGWAGRASVLRGSVLGPLSWVAHRSGVEKFDLVFMGPPYRDEENRPLAYSSPVLKHLAESGLVAPEGWVIAQHHKKERVDRPEGLEPFRESKYGDTLITFFRPAR
jgi:16S rRNA (guanine966-N2)-methyltransferase